MTINDSRSMNSDLHSGVNDGRLKSITPGRGGVVDQSHPSVRASLLQNQYNITDMMSGISPKVMDHDYEMGYAED